MSSKFIHRSALLLLLLCAGAAAAFDQPQSEKDWDPPAPPEEVMQSLSQVAKQFGPYAVILQSALLNEAVRNGSILEAKVDVPEYRQRDGKQYLAFTLESGIVYNDNSVNAEQRLRRTWQDIVASALRRLTEVEFDKVDGLAIRVGYHHRPYENEREVREQLPEGRGQPEQASYYFALADAVALAKGTVDSEKVLEGVTVLRGDDLVPLH